MDMVRNRSELKVNWDYTYMLGGCKNKVLDTTCLLFVVIVTQGKAYVPLKLRTSIRLGMGGSCTRRGGCNTISPLVSIAKQ